MTFNERFDSKLSEVPFAGYEEYSQHLFAVCDRQLDSYLENLMNTFASEKGGFKNVLYPDIEVAKTLSQNHLFEFGRGSVASDEVPEAMLGEAADDLANLFGDFSDSISKTSETSEGVAPISELLDQISARADLTVAAGIKIPIHELARKLKFTDFTLFCFALGLLSSNQTNYASIFQVTNQNSSLPAPTFESAARVYHGHNFVITDAYAQMSQSLEQLRPLFDFHQNGSLPFSTPITPDKRLIDYIFGANPERIDDTYKRFFTMLTDDEELDPLLANIDQADSLAIAYDDDSRIFNLYGDEGSGRKFTIKHFCADKKLKCIGLDGGKLFKYDMAFLEKAIWSAIRECILLEACCCLSNLSYREEEKDHFYSYMDLVFTKLSEKDIPIFTMSMVLLPLRDMTTLKFTTIELPTPDNREREKLWNHYGATYNFEDEVSLEEMATKFLFTPGKIKSALAMGKSLSLMKKLLKTSRAALFEACNNQMSTELTQKATKVKATYTWDDIVMSPDQRQSLEYACDQMRFRKQVYEEWDYNRKYPYGRGLTVLLFGAPGTGKSMCAQVLANALNLELYRVDLSKVVDKYVGETEKSISMIFREAKKCNVVLFFDECDTLFAKRSDDGGSSQSSNNNKTALLLQEVEAYDGVSVLATNYKHNIDPAFFRRMKFIVEFQFPDADTREMLWNATIPKNTPLAEDVDVRFLAERFEFVGGNIKNCILNAAFLAAGDPEADGEVGMKHYLQAIRYEFVKTGKVFTRSDFEPYANLIL
ncbi:ATPase AAA [Clostridia bacterium]|nr:ATPase AAA [Clostridia bacterium]